MGVPQGIKEDGPQKKEQYLKRFLTYVWIGGFNDLRSLLHGLN